MKKFKFFLKIFLKNLNSNLNPSYFVLENFETSIPFLELSTVFSNFSSLCKGIKTDQQVYDQYAVPINIKLAGLEPLKQINDFKVNYTITEIYTEYYGKCQMYQFFGRFEIGRFIIFEASRSESNYAMVIPPETEIFFNYNWLYTSPTAIQIKSDITINIKK